MTNTLITRAGFARLLEELDRLTTAGRQEIAERFRDAVSTGANPAENADYLDARAEQALLECRIAILRQRIAAAQVVEPDGLNGILDLGERVRLHDLETGERVEYELVGSLEADPSAGRISAASPVGQAVRGRQQGDVVIVEAPKGWLRFKILDIEGDTDADLWCRECGYGAAAWRAPLACPMCRAQAWERRPSRVTRGGASL